VILLDFNNEKELDLNLNTEPTLLHRVIFVLTVVSMMVAIYLVFMYANIERVMGPVQKIFYFHVGTAAVAAIAFFVVFVCSIMYLITKKRIYDVYAGVSGEIGVVFTTLVLLTGPIWAKAAWNVWWNWEPRLTTTLILWFIYVAYIMIRLMEGAWDKKARLASVFGIIGFIDVPIVYFSVQWWETTLHPVVVSKGGGGLEGNMIVALVASIIALTFLYVLLLQKGVRVEKSKIELQHMKARIAEKFSR